MYLHKERYVSSNNSSSTVNILQQRLCSSQETNLRQSTHKKIMHDVGACTEHAASYCINGVHLYTVLFIA